MALPPSWSPSTATTPAHSTFLQLLTSPPSNQERGEERKDERLSGGLFYNFCMGTPVQRCMKMCRKQLLLITFVSCSQSILNDQFLSIFSAKLFLSMLQCTHHSLSVQSCSWTAQVTGGQGQDGPLLCSLLLLPQADPGAVFTLLITGEGPADRRAITDSPQARGWERYKNPLPSPKCDGNVQLSWGSLHWQNPRVQREILKT